MREERLNINTDELNHYLEEAQRLRTKELARIGGQFFKLPQSLLNLFGKSAGSANKTASQVS